MDHLLRQSIGGIIFFLFMSFSFTVLFWLVMRPIILWYFRINEIRDLLKEIRNASKPPEASDGQKTASPALQPTHIEESDPPAASDSGQITEPVNDDATDKQWKPPE